MASIDQRIVELKFNGKNFQSGIQAAIASLDNLKKSLNLDKAANEFDKVEKASKKVNFNDLNSSVENISQRFSTLGIIGMSALNQITTAAMQTGKKLLSALVSPLVEGGKRRALNIEQAKFQIEGLGYTWSQVEADINYGVKDTAYGLDAAAKAASQLLASQVKVGDEMKASLRGISGVAAMTSSEYEDIAQIFTTVAGNGRLMGDQLMQLSSRGLNAAATLGQYLGKSESEIRDMVSKGKIDFNTFANAMDSAFGEHAKKANETFTGSLSNMKAALARIGAEVASPAYTNLRDIFNSLTPVIDGVKAALVEKGGLIDSIKSGMTYVTNFATNTLNSLGGKEGVAALLAPAMEKVNRILKAFGSLLLGVAKTINGVVSPIFSAFSEVLGGSLLDALGGAIEILAKFVNSIAFTERMSNNLKKTFVGIFTVINVLFKAITGIIGVIADTMFSVFSATFGFVLDVILAITGHIGDFIVRIHKLVKEFMGLKTIQDILSGISNAFERIRTVVIKVYSAFRNLVGVIIDNAFESALWIFDKLASAVLLLAKYVDKAITKLREFVRWLKSLPAVQGFATNLKNTFQNIQSNIGSVASELGGKFIAAFKNARQVVGDFIERLKELIGQYIELPTLQDVITAVVEFMTTTFEKAVELFNNAKEVLGKILDRVAELNEVSLKGIIENFGKLKDKIIEVIDISGRLAWLKETFGSIKDGAVQAASGTATTLNLIKEKIGQFVEWLKTKFNNLTMGDIMAAGIGGSFIVFLVQLTKFIKTADKLTASLDKVVGFFNKITKSITGAIDSFAELNKAKAQSIKMEAIADLIKSVVLLAGAVALLASMDPNRVMMAAGVILVLAGGLIGLSAAMNAISSKTDPKTIAATATQMIAASGSILVLAAALKLLSTIPVDRLISGLVAITVLMAEVMGFMVLLGRWAPQIVKESFSMLLVATSLIVLARAMAMIGAMGVKDIVSSVAVITALMVGLGIMFKLSGEVAMSKHAAAGILAITVSLMLIVHSLKTIANMDSSTITKGLSRMMAVMGSFTLLMLATKLAGKHAAKAGAAILLISVSMNIMVLAIKQMASIDDGMLAQATKSINEMLKVFALITLMTAFAGKNAISAGGSIMMMAGAIAIIAGAMILLSRISDDDLNRATKVITTILGMFGLIVAATGLAKKCHKTILQITICLGMLVAAVAVLSLIEPANILSASLAISMILATFALLASSTGKIVPKAMASVWSLVGVVGALGVVIAALAQVPNIESALYSATAISELLAVVGGLVVAMSFIRVAPDPGTAALFAVAIDIIIAIIGALVVAVGAINTYIPQFEEFLTNGIPIMQKIGQAIGEFVGGIIGGIAAGASYGLITLAENLTAFIEALKPFMDEVSNIDDSVVDGAMKLVEMMLLFAAADLLNALTFWYDGKSAIESMAEGLPTLGKAMTDFASSLDGVNLDALAVGAQAAQAIATVGLIFSEGGLKGFLLGDSAEGLGNLGENLPLLGDGLKKYGESVANLNVEAINASVEPAKSLVEISNMINGEGDSVLNWFMGSNAEGLSRLSENLPLLGDALTKYGESVDGLLVDAINNSLEPLRTLVEISNMIESEGGDFMGWFMGSHAEGIARLSENLPLLGDALTTYGESVSDLKADAINNSLDPLRALVQISNMIESEGGDFLGWFMGSHAEGIARLSENLPGLGNALKEYGNSLDGLKSDLISSSIDPLRSLVEISNMIDNSGGAQSWIFGNSAEGVDQFNQNLPKLGEALKEYSKKVRLLNPEAITRSVECLSNIIGVLNSIKDGISSFFGGGTGSGVSVLKDNLPGLGEALKTYSDNVTDLGVDAINASVECLQKIVESIGNAGGSSETMRMLAFDIKQFAESFTDAIGKFDGLNYDAVDSAIEAIKKLYDAMNNFGEGLPDLGPSLDGFISTLESAANSGVNAFITAFEFGSFMAGVAAAAMVSQVVLAMTIRLEEAKGEFTVLGQGIITAFGEGLYSSSSLALSALDMVVAGMTAKIEGSSVIFLGEGRNIVNNLATGIGSTVSLPINAMDSILKQLIARLVISQSDFRSKGNQLIVHLTNGMKTGFPLVIAVLTALANQMIQRLAALASSMTAQGVRLMSAFASGIRSGASQVTAAVASAVSGISSIVNRQYYAMMSSGSYLMAGLRNGIVGGSSGPINAAYNVGRDVVQALRNATGEASPSKEAKKVGMFFDKGLLIGIVKYSGEVIDSVTELGEDIVDEINPLSDKLTFLEDFTPVITPKIDTSYVENGIAAMRSDMDSLGGLPIDMQGRYMATAFRAMTNQQLLAEELQNRMRTSQVINNYDLTQNNYSPKALSRIDIYRDTRNQFTRLKEVVNA